MTGAPRSGTEYRNTHHVPDLLGTPRGSEHPSNCPRCFDPRFVNPTELGPTNQCSKQTQALLIPRPSIYNQTKTLVAGVKTWVVAFQETLTINAMPPQQLVNELRICIDPQLGRFQSFTANRSAHSLPCQDDASNGGTGAPAPRGHLDILHGWKAADSVNQHAVQRKVQQHRREPALRWGDMLGTPPAGRIQLDCPPSMRKMSRVSEM